jgi:hypothetical protein
LSVLQSLKNTAYNFDRMIASMFGAPPQETISSEIGRHEARCQIAEEAADVLDAIQPGHVEKALADANRLESTSLPCRINAQS